MSCEDYPTAQTAKTFKLDAETVNEVVTLEQDRTSEASDGKTKKTLWGIENDATNQRDEFEQLASDQRDSFEASFSSQFNFKRIGNISDYAGQSLPEADKLNSYQFPDNSGDWYVPEQGQSFPITIPADPTASGSNWYLQSPSGVYRGLWPDTGGIANKGDTYQTQVGGTGTGQYFTALQNTTVDPVGDDVNWREVVSFSSISGANLISNASFEVAGSVTSPPDATARDYNAGDELFQGVFAAGALTGVTYTSGELNGTSQLYTDVYKSEKQKLSTATYVASIAGSNGIPLESGASFTDEGDYWRVTFDMTETFSVKFEQGSVATRHDIKSLFDIYGDPALTGVINVKAFGATGNGVTDDYQAISDAISYLRDESTRSGNIYFPVGEYLVSQPLDCTNFAGGGLYLEGERSSAVALSRLGSTIVGDTGAMVIDMCGTQSSLISDLNIVAGSDNPSTGGIFQARSQTSQYAQFNRFERLSIYFDHDSSANSGRGTYGIYNNASELCSYKDLHIRADTPFLGVAYNPWGITSNYQTIETGIVSSSQLSLTNVTLVSLAPDGFDGQSLRVQSVFGFKSSITYLLMSKNDHPILIDNFARNFELSGHVEGTNKLMNISNTIGAKLDVTCELTSFAPIQMGDLSTFTFVEGLDLEINSANSDAVTAPYLIEALQTSSLSGVNILSPTPRQIPLTNIFDANVNGVIRNKGVEGIVIEGAGSITSTEVKSEFFTLTDQADPTSVNVNSLYLSSVDNKPYYKDSAGVSHAIY